MPNEKKLEAMAKDPTVYGEPYVIAGKKLPPGEWVTVTEGEAAMMTFYPEVVKVREAKS